MTREHTGKQKIIAMMKSADSKHIGATTEGNWNQEWDDTAEGMPFKWRCHSQSKGWGRGRGVPGTFWWDRSVGEEA